MWFQFAKDVDKRSRLFYGFPALEWGPPNVARIAVDGATRKIHDPSERTANVVNPEDIKDTQDFIREHVTGVDWTVPAFTMTCLQTNVYGTGIYPVKTFAVLTSIRQYVRPRFRTGKIPQRWRER